MAGFDGVGSCCNCGASVPAAVSLKEGGAALCGACSGARAPCGPGIPGGEDCARCGAGMAGRERGTWRDGSPYCDGCMKEAEAVWVLENSCMRCGARVPERDERFFPPEKVQGTDGWVRNGCVSRRFVCRECFCKVTGKPYGSVMPRRRAGAESAFAALVRVVLAEAF